MSAATFSYFSSRDLSLSSMGGAGGG
jgi:hypothetical protein